MDNLITLRLFMEYYSDGLMQKRHNSIANTVNFAFIVFLHQAISMTF